MELKIASVKDCTLDELLELANLFKDASDEFPGFPSNYDLMDRIRKNFLDCHSFYAQFNGKIIGAIAYDDVLPKRWKDDGIVDNLNEPCAHTLIVSEDYRNRNIALPLALAMFEDAKNRGYRSITLETWFNKSNNPQDEFRVWLYQLVGFQIFHIDNKERNNPSYGSVYMRRKL